MSNNNDGNKILLVRYNFTYILTLIILSELQSAHDLTNFVKNLLDQMNERFKSMTDSIVGRYIQLLILCTIKLE